MSDIASLSNSLDSIAKLVRLLEKEGITKEQLLLPVSDRVARRNLATYLKAGCPATDSAPKEVQQKPGVLAFHADITVGSLPKPIDLLAFYKTRNGLWVSDSFGENVLASASAETLASIASLRSYDLVKDAYDREIEAELPREYEITLSHIAELIERQKNGENGELLTNGYTNIFYVAGRVVSVHWNADYRQWRVDAWELGNGHWRDGFRVFSRN